MKKDCRNGASLSEGALWGEPRRRAPLLVTPKDMLSKAVEMDVCFHRGPASGEHGGTLLSRVFFWEKWYISLFRGIFVRSLSDMLKGPCTRAAVSIGALLGNLEGFVYWDIWWKKGRYIWVPFSWTQRNFKVKPGCHLEL
jgi:hypothetical protein